MQMSVSLELPVEYCFRMSAARMGNNSFYMPPSWKEDSTLFVTNIVLIMIIGVFGNLLTLITVPYAACWHKDKFPRLWSPTTILLLHLSLCDLLYCLLGLPMFLIGTFSIKWLNSVLFCYISTTARVIVAVADFLTVAAIALTRSIGILRTLGFRKMVCNRRLNLSIYWLLVLIWVLSILINIFFKIVMSSVLDIDWFGFDTTVTRCFATFGIGAIIPCFTTFFSYLILGLCLRRHIVKHKQETNQESSAEKKKLQVHLWILTLAYLFFMLPMIIVDTGLLNLLVSDSQEESVARLLYSIYWWVFPVNFFIYLVFIKDFRDVYKHCLIGTFVMLRNMLCNQSN